MAGYSGTPLARKLGIREGTRLAVVDPPGHYWSLLPELPAGIAVVEDDAAPADLVHVFVRDRAALAARLPELRERIRPAGAVWVSWPKKASRVPTDLTGNVVRALALENGLVDVKVCAVDDTWSGLKLVIPVRDR